MKQEPKSIQDFKPGDIVTRVHPAIMPPEGPFMGVNYDMSYIGQKLIFLGIANGCAYFEPTDPFDKILERGKPIQLVLFKFEDGWAHYIDPLTLVNAKPRSQYESLSDTSLLDKLESAIGEEDYEEASRIQHEIDRRQL